MTTAFQAAIVLAAAEGGKTTMAVAGAGAARFAAREAGRSAIWWGTQQALEWLFSQFGWDWDPSGNDPYPPGPNNNCGGCIAYPSGGTTILQYIDTQGNRMTPSQPTAEGGWLQLDSWALVVLPDGTVDPTRATLYGKTGNGEPYSSVVGSPNGFLCVFLSSNLECIRTGSSGGEATPDPVYVETGDCTYKTQFISYIYDSNQQPQGVLSTVGPDDREEEFAVGDGPITQCNISPTYVYIDAKGGEDVFIDPIGPDGEPLDIDEIVRRIKDPIVEEINNNTDERIEEY